MWFCPLDGTLLQIITSTSDSSSRSRNTFACSTCPYSQAISSSHPHIQKSYPTNRKKVDDILGGASAWENVDRTSAVLAAAKEVANPMFFGVLIITVVYVPILALQGIEGKMFKPMALVVMLALGASLVLALTLMPVLCSFLLSGKIEEKDNWLVTLTKRIYTPLLHFGLRFRWLVVAAMLALLGSSAWTFSKLGAEFIPQLDEGDFAFQFT